MPAVNRINKKWCRRLLSLALVSLVGGCNILGVIAGKMPSPDIAASYKGLANQTVGVVVWVDRSTQIDWPTMQLDMANSVNAKLVEAAKTCEELKGMQIPYEPRSFVKYQKEHPGSSDLPIVELAPKLGVSRLIYIEITNFTSRANNADTLFLGQMDGTLKVIEVENGVAKVGYSETDLHVQYPKKATRDGVPNQNDRSIYTNTLNDMSTEMSVRFFKHPDPNN